MITPHYTDQDSALKEGRLVPASKSGPLLSCLGQVSRSRTYGVTMHTSELANQESTDRYRKC